LRFVDDFLLRFVASDRVMRDGEDLAVQQAVASEVEGIDLDRRILPTSTKPWSGK
jgi:hypothetical protein